MKTFQEQIAHYQSGNDILLERPAVCIIAYKCPLIYAIDVSMFLLLFANEHVLPSLLLLKGAHTGCVYCRC